MAELRRLWDREAERNHVLPLFDNLVDRLGAFICPALPAGDDRTYRPGSSPIFDESFSLLFGGFRFPAEGRLSFAFARAAGTLEVPGRRPHRGPDGCAFHLLHDDTVTFDGLLPVALQRGGARLRLGHDIRSGRWSSRR